MSLATRFASRSPALRSPVPLLDDQIRTVAPSIFAEEAHESRSERYSYIPTINVLHKLRAEGFQPFFVTQTRVRDEGNREYTKHMLRMRHASQINAAEADEIIIVNAHNGASSFQLLAGQFRFVCSNGLVCGNTFEDIRVKHKGQIIDSVVEGANKILNGFGLVREVKEEFKSITLDAEEANLLATAAIEFKYDREPGESTPITAAQVLRPKRAEDTASDLWTRFNVVQENIMQGGLTGRTATNRRTTTRPVVGIDQNVKINRALWTLTERFAALKKG